MWCGSFLSHLHLFFKKPNAAAPLCSLAESVAFRCLLFEEDCKSEMSAWKTKSLHTHRKIGVEACYSYARGDGAAGQQIKLRAACLPYVLFLIALVETRCNLVRYVHALLGIECNGLVQD